MATVNENTITKDFYTTQELIKEPWFPIRSTLTIKKLIEAGRLEAIDVSTSPRFKRYRISKQSVMNFMTEQNTFTVQGVEKEKSKKKYGKNK